MKKLFASIIIIIIIVLAFLGIDYFNVKNNKKPIFVIKTETYNDGSVRYSGIGYHVYHVKILGIDSGHHFRIWFTDDIDEVKEKIIKDAIEDILP
ncbi:MAG: hypothetical protein ACOX02_01700 [Acholeplasmatales bacterium]